MLDSLSKAKELGEYAKKEANVAEEEAYYSQGRVSQVQERDQNAVVLHGSSKVPPDLPSGQLFIPKQVSILFAFILYCEIIKTEKWHRVFFRELIPTQELGAKYHSLNRWHNRILAWRRL